MQDHQRIERCDATIAADAPARVGLPAAIWSTIFAENASDQLRLILRYCGIKISFETMIDVYSSHALDPHVDRCRFKNEWWG